MASACSCGLLRVPPLVPGSPTRATRTLLWPGVEGSGHTHGAWAMKPVGGGGAVPPADVQEQRGMGAQGERPCTQGSWLKSQMNREAQSGASAHTASDIIGGWGAGWRRGEGRSGEQQRKLRACRGTEARRGGSKAAGPGAPGGHRQGHRASEGSPPCRCTGSRVRQAAPSHVIPRAELQAHQGGRARRGLPPRHRPRTKGGPSAEDPRAPPGPGHPACASLSPS